MGVTLEGLVVVDLDMGEGKNGFDSIKLLGEQGYSLPKTYTQTTANKGAHLFYNTDEVIKSSTSKIGAGIDIKSGANAYVVCSGSTIGSKFYTDNGEAISPLPEEFKNLCGRATEKKEKVIEKELIGDTPEPNIEFGKKYLLESAPIAIQHQGGDQTTLQVAMRLRDEGITRQDALDLMLKHWNDRCEPPWDIEELGTKIANAYNYAKLPMGNKDPKRVFEEVKEDPKELSPIEKLNKKYAFISLGGYARIIREIDDWVDFLLVETFKYEIAAQEISSGKNKTEPLSEAWLKSPNRRSYVGVCFDPSKTHNPIFYNMWKGFSVSLPKEGELFPQIAHDALKNFLDHTLQNICNGDVGTNNWVLDFCAHLVQKPEQKAKVALVLKGPKGVGKNFFIQTIGKMFGIHYKLTSERRYLLGNFNSHYENNLIMVFDEAFWSGDKQSEGKLKDLVTGDVHRIEHKGLKTYDVANLTRVVILGEEDWVVPAGDDERRYTVCQVGRGKQQNTVFFEKIQKGMEAGGIKLLFKYLMERDISKWDRFKAYETEGLYEQKIESLPLFRKWWFESISEERLLNHADSQWPQMIEKTEFFRAFKSWVNENTGTKWIPSENKMAKDLKMICPSLKFSKKRQKEMRFWVVVLPSVETAREEWDKFMRFKTKWNRDVAETMIDTSMIPVDNVRLFQ